MPELIEIEIPCEPCKTEVCPRCEGRQKVTIETYIHGYCDIEIDCPECFGEGWVERETEEAA
jgi:DnaJ-class molecular chaperone